MLAHLDLVNRHAHHSDEDTSLIMRSKMVWRKHEPEPPVEDLRDAIDDLRKRTAELELQPSTALQDRSYTQLLVLARDTVADGETIYAQSIASGSVIADDVTLDPKVPDSITLWLHQLVSSEARQRVLQPIGEEVNEGATSSSFPGTGLTSDRNLQLPTLESDHILDSFEEVDHGLELKHSIVHRLFNDARVLFDTQSYYDARCRLLRMLAMMRKLESAVPGLVGYYDLQYMLAVTAFYTKDSMTSQKALLDFIRQEVFDDDQRLKVAHTSQLLAEVYVNIGNLRQAQLSCNNALQTHHQLSEHGDRMGNECFALAARIENLLGDSDSADAYTYSIDMYSQQGVVTKYARLAPETSLSRQERQDLILSECELSKYFQLDGETGRVQLRSDIDLSKNKLTPLHVAVMFCDTSYASALIDTGAEVNAEAWPDFEIMYWYGGGALTPLSCAIRTRHENMIRLLVSKGATLATSPTSFPTLTLMDKPFLNPNGTADVHGMITCFKHLGWDGDSPVDDLDRCMVHIAAEHNYMDIVEALLSHSYKSYVRDKTGSVALQAALRSLETKPFLSMAKLLLQTNTSEQLHNKNHAGQTVLHCAAYVEHPEYVVQFLVARGSNVLTKDENGNIPLNVAILSRCSARDIHSFMRTHTRGQLSSRNLEGKTPLQVAFTGHYTSAELVLELLKAGANPLDTDDTGKTPAERIYEIWRPYGEHNATPIVDCEIWSMVWDILVKVPQVRDLFSKLDLA